MRICGLKLTHDGSIAVIDDSKLIFAIEMEKLHNNLRYAGIEETSIIATILEEYGYSVSSIDYFAVDGWGGFDQDALAIQPRLHIGAAHNKLAVTNHNQPYSIDVAQYQERTLKHNVLEEWAFRGLPIDKYNLSYLSYLHSAGHIMSAYCTSPFAQNNESSYILVWDGGMFPRLYYFHAAAKCIENLGPIFLLIGNAYTIFSQHFGPFKVRGSFAKDNLSVAGKVMAYIALGKVREELFAVFDEIYNKHYGEPMGFANTLANVFKQKIEGQTYSDEDILCTFHAYLGKMLQEKLEKKISRTTGKVNNLCIAGGCALNIKWNSTIRNGTTFKAVYVPPFPNDAGSAIGAACAAMFNKTGTSSLQWSVYSGPPVISNQPAAGWQSRNCSLTELAEIIHRTSEPVIFLNDRAELGPRALGNRSIIGAATSPGMKDILNLIKDRESYRPVSPMCLESRAKHIFEPGIKDPYMLFDHMLKAEWADRVPAIRHLDGSARLQTVNRQSNEVVHELLEQYEKLSGIPLLCNTSANYKGKGFFPDIYSATSWNKVNYVWCNYILYEKEDKVVFG